MELVRPKSLYLSGLHSDSISSVFHLRYLQLMLLQHVQDQTPRGYLSPEIQHRSQTL